MGTRNQLVTVARHSSGISSLLRHPIDGKYSPIDVSSTKKQIRESILILSVAHGAAVAAVRDIHPANVMADICNVDAIGVPINDYFNIDLGTEFYLLLYNSHSYV